MELLFGRTKNLIHEIDDFLNAISEGMLIFREGVHSYLTGKREQFVERLKQINQRESDADDLRRSIEDKLYRHSLIPEHRGDVLALLETTDPVVDTAKRTLILFDTEKPDIPEEFHQDFEQLVKVTTEAAEKAVQSMRAFFENLNDVKNHLHKVYYYEKEADELGDSLNRKIFATDLELSRKMHLRYFSNKMEAISDRAQDVADRISIYSIKRMP